MKKCKTKAIQADEGLFTHIVAYSDILKRKQSICIFRTLCNLGIFRTLAYTEQKAYFESWYNNNSGMFRTVLYWEPWSIQNPVKPLLWSVSQRLNFFHNKSENFNFNSKLKIEKGHFFFNVQFSIFI